MDGSRTPSLPGHRRRGSVASLSLVSVTLLLCCVGTLAAVPVEQNVLLELKSAFNPFFNHLTSWVRGTDCSLWVGIVCDSAGYVITLDVSHRGISIRIPSSIGTLTKLQRLKLNNNYFVGEIPPTLGNLKNLVHLDISESGINGSIPATFGNLNKLQQLYLFTTELSGPIGDFIGNLKSLQELDVSKSQLSGEIPTSVGTLTNLVKLVLSDNQLSGSIPPLESLVKLVTLDLSDNQLTGTIPSVSSLNNLQTLYLHSNQLTGSIVSAFNGLTLLKDLDLHSNYFVGNPPTICSSSSQCLLDSNCLKGLMYQKNSSDCWNYCTSTSASGNCGDFSTTMCF